MVFIMNLNDLKYGVLRFYIEYGFLFVKSDKPKIHELDNSKYNQKPLYNQVLIKGIPNIDNYIPKDSYKRYNKEKKHDKPIFHKKTYELGFKSFLSFIKPFIQDKNIINYYNRYFNIFDELNKTFEFKKVYKINLNSIDLEKLNKTYLLFKNDLDFKNNNIKVSFIKYDEFIKNTCLKSSPLIHNDLKYNFDTNRNYNKNNDLLNDIIIIVEILGYDEKYNYLLVNRRCYADILKTINLNKVSWYNKKHDKLFRKIKKYQYTFIDIDSKYNDILKNLNDNKKELKYLDKKLDYLKKELLLLIKSKKTNNDRFNKLNKDFETKLIQFNDLQDKLIYLDELLIELDRKNDEFINNQLEYNKNYSLRLKTYLD